MKILDNSAMSALAKILGETRNGFTQKELSEIIDSAGIAKVDDGSYRNGYVYKIGLNKRDWLLACFNEEHRIRHDDTGILKFLQIAFSPIRFTSDNRRELYHSLLDETNKILLLIGMKITIEGKLVSTEAAKTLDEVDSRVNRLRAEMRNRFIHPQIVKFCQKDILRKDYFDIVSESAKSLAERVREISGSKLDGGQLFQEVFSTKKPMIFFNTLQTESENSEFKGLKELLEAIYHLIRNPAAHTPKINWKVDEEKAMDILTMISFAHKYLDVCCKMPGISHQMP